MQIITPWSFSVDHFGRETLLLMELKVRPRDHQYDSFREIVAFSWFKVVLWREILPKNFLQTP